MGLAQPITFWSGPWHTRKHGPARETPRERAHSRARFLLLALEGNEKKVNFFATTPNSNTNKPASQQQQQQTRATARPARRRVKRGPRHTENDSTTTTNNDAPDHCLLLSLAALIKAGKQARSQIPAQLSRSVSFRKQTQHTFAPEKCKPARVQHQSGRSRSGSRMRASRPTWPGWHITRPNCNNQSSSSNNNNDGEAGSFSPEA